MSTSVLNSAPPILPNSASEKSSFEKREIEMSEMCKKFL